MAATVAAQECIWIKRLLQDIWFAVNYPIPISCDNESINKLASNPVFHASTKHIEVHYHFVCEKMLKQEIVLKKVGTNDQVADVFTKALSRAKFEKFRSALGVVDSSFSLRRSVANQCHEFVKVIFIIDLGFIFTKYEYSVLEVPFV